MSASIYAEPEAVFSRLVQLGLSSQILRDAVAMGEAAYNSCTSNDPLTSPGYLAWARTIRGLRELLVVQGWVKEHDKGLETVVSPDGGMAIAVAQGDENTGKRGFSPKTKRSRGPISHDVVSLNQLSFAFIEQRDRQNPFPRVTWVLLMSRDEQEIRCELSLPESIGHDGRFDRWSERIILAPVVRDLDPHILLVDQEPDIEVHVSRRSG